MAILKSLPSIQITVHMSGQTMQEYDNNDDEEAQMPRTDKDRKAAKYKASKTVSKYIESVAGKYFTIKLAILSPYKFTGGCSGLSFDIYIDGTKTHCPLYLKQSGSPWQRIVSGVPNQDDSGVRKFKFSDLQAARTGLRLDAGSKAHALQSIGEIEVRVFRIKVLRRAKACRSTKSAEKSARQRLKSEVHEDQLKGQAKSHKVGLGAIEKVNSPQFWDTEKCDGEDRPLAVFKFRYGSKENLKSLGVIERTPEPESSPEPEPEETPTPAMAPVRRAPSTASLQPNLPNQNNLNPGSIVQTAQLFNDFLQFLQTRDGQQAQAVAAPTTSAPPSGIAPTAVADRRIKREREENDAESRKKKRRQRGKVTVSIDLTGDDSDDAIELSD